MGIAVLLILVLFCGYADEAAAIPEGDPAEAEASEEAFTEAESALPAENEEPAGVPESESTADETEESPQLVSETAPVPQMKRKRMLSRFQKRLLCRRRTGL